MTASAYVSGYCLTYHATKPCQGNGGPDCAGCPMPSRETRQVDHLAYTDHSIARQPGLAKPDHAERLLRSFWKGDGNERDLALGYATVAPLRRQLAP